MPTQEQQLADLRVKYQTLETLVIGEMGLIKSVQELKDSMAELKAYQFKVMGGFGVLAVGSQFIIQLLLK